MSCMNCWKWKWRKWKAKKISKEREKWANEMACSEECFLEWSATEVKNGS